MNKIILALLMVCISILGIQAQTIEAKSKPVSLNALFAPVESAKTDKPVIASQSSTIQLTSDVDVNIPKTSKINANAIAVVIGNRDYQKTKNVDYAIQDARTIKKYLVEAMGFKEGNIFYHENATKIEFDILFGDKDSYKGKLFNAIKPQLSDVFIFYSGHGAPDLDKFTGYFVPVDSDPQYIGFTGYNSEVFFNNIAQLPAKSTTIVLDACFSGASLLEGVSPIGIKSKTFENVQNGVLLSSSAGTQVSSWYSEMNHGMFTYFFLKAIHNSNADYDLDGNITAEEIYQFVSDKAEGVPYYARRFRNVEQTPTIQGDKRDQVIFSLN